MILTKKVKITLDFNQQLIVETLSNEHRLLYNYLLELSKTTSDFKKLNLAYKNYRHSNKLTISSKSAQNTCINLINNIKSFYALKKKDKTHSFPYKFKSYKYFCSFMYDSNGGRGGFSIENGELIINLLSSSKNSKKLEIKIESNWIKDISTRNVKTMTFIKNNESGEYFICFVYDKKTESNFNLESNKFLSIDLGYSNLVSGVTNIGENILVENYRQKDLDDCIKNLTSKRDKRKKNSRKYKKFNKALKRKRNRKVNKQIDNQHKVSRKIVEYCLDKGIGRLIVGDLEVKKVQKKENNKINGLSKSSGLGRFKTFLGYKAKGVGLEFELVNEYNSSKKNCLSEKVEFDSSLANREFEWKGIKINRDFNSGINFLPKVGIWLTQDEKIRLLNNCIIKIHI